MPDLSSQFDLSPTNCVANGQFETGDNWTQVAGEDEDLTIGDGEMVCTGNGRNVAQQTVTGGNLQDGDTVLLMVECSSGSGVCSFGDNGIAISPGTQCIFCTVQPTREITFDFEDTACVVDSVRIRKAVFAS